MLEIYTIYFISPLPRDLHVNGFLGYDSGHKGYCWWDPVACRIWVSCDVTFDEFHPFFSNAHSYHESVHFFIEW
jgi:hypothetical protein